MDKKKTASAAIAVNVNQPAAAPVKAAPEAAAPVVVAEPGAAAPVEAAPEAAAPVEAEEFVAVPEVVVERAQGCPITLPPEPNRHYCVYPRDAANPPADPAAVITALKASFAGSNFTYFANR